MSTFKIICLVKTPTPGWLSGFAPAAELCSWPSHRWTPPLQPCLRTSVSGSSCGRHPSSPIEPQGWAAGLPHSNSTRATWTQGPKAHIESRRRREQRPPRPPAPWPPSETGLLRERTDIKQPFNRSGWWPKWIIQNNNNKKKNLKRKLIKLCPSFFFCLNRYYFKLE